MNEFGPYYGGSTINYDRARRRRQWSQNGTRGLEGYAAFLAGAEGAFDPTNIGAAAGAETAAMESSGSMPILRSVAVGVATGAITFLLNRWLAKVFK